MAPARAKKRASDQSTTTAVATKVASPSTPRHTSPIKNRKMRINAQQKQALIENLQLEITERARRLRAQYHLQAQGLRSRIEIRVNRIPTSLRKITMGELLQRCAEQEKRGTAPLPPPKDVPRHGSPTKNAQTTNRVPSTRPRKRLSDEISADKENEMQYPGTHKKRARGAHAAATGPVRPGQVLSPTSSNSRIGAGRDRERPASPAKGHAARPASPLKTGGTSRSAAATNLLSSMVEKAKSSRSAAAQRKVTTTSNTSSNSSNAAAAGPSKTRRAPGATGPPSSRPATRNGRRVSVNSETSEGSATTVVRKGAAAPKAGTTTTKRVMGTFRKGTVGADAKRPAAKTATSATASSTGRVLRKRT